MTYHESIGSTTDIVTVDILEMFKKTKCSKMKKMVKDLNKMTEKKITLYSRIYESDSKLVDIEIDWYLYETYGNLSKKEALFKKIYEKNFLKHVKLENKLHRIQNKIINKSDEYQLCLVVLKLKKNNYI
jgi:hypothetical protein